MKLRNKIAIGIAILIALIAISTGVEATEFRSRLIGAELNLGANVTVFQGKTNVTEIVPEYTFSATSTTALTRTKVINAKTLFCADKKVSLASNADYKIDPKDAEVHEYPEMVDGVISEESYMMAYILSEVECDRVTLTDGIVQQALWYMWDQTEEGEQPNDLYKAAKQYAKYKKAAETQEIEIDTSKAKITDTSDGKGYSIGYFKATFPTAHYKHGDFGYFKATFPTAHYKHGDFERKFGEILDIKLIDGNGNEVSKSKWKITNKDHDEISGYPSSGAKFYIETTTKKNIEGPFKISITFNTVDAEGYYQKLYGTHWVSIPTEDSQQATIHYCPTCQAILDAHGGRVDGGYVYDEEVVRVLCGTRVYDRAADNDIPGVAEKISSRIANCGKDVVCLDGVSRKCGTEYTFFGMQLKAKCLLNVVPVTRRVYVAKIGCGAIIYDYEHQYIDPKTNEPVINTWRCGYGYVPYDHEELSQELITVGGKRTTTEMIFTIDMKPEQEIIKVDDDGNNLAGAELAIKDSSGKIWNCANLIMNGRTGTDLTDEELFEIRNTVIEECCKAAGGEVTKSDKYVGCYNGLEEEYKACYNKRLGGEE